MHALKVAAAAALCILAIVPSIARANESLDTQFVGFWELDYDEDGTPRDTMEFTAEGRYVMHGIECDLMESFPYHVYRGNLFVALDVPDKGPIAMIFHSNVDGRLSFTSPRTRQNAYYKRLSADPCNDEDEG
ncbi:MULTISPECIES: hypothetical protein [unclassified Luteimonas]